MKPVLNMNPVPNCHKITADSDARVDRKIINMDGNFVRIVFTPGSIRIGCTEITEEAASLILQHYYEAYPKQTQPTQVVFQETSVRT